MGAPCGYRNHWIFCEHPALRSRRREIGSPTRAAGNPTIDGQSCRVTLMIDAEIRPSPANPTLNCVKCGLPLALSQFFLTLADGTSVHPWCHKIQKEETTMSSEAEAIRELASVLEVVCRYLGPTAEKARLRAEAVRDAHAEKKPPKKK